MCTFPVRLTFRARYNCSSPGSFRSRPVYVFNIFNSNEKKTIIISQTFTRQIRFRIKYGRRELNAQNTVTTPPPPDTRLRGTGLGNNNALDLNVRRGLPPPPLSRCCRSRSSAAGAGVMRVCSTYEVSLFHATAFQFWLFVVYPITFLTAITDAIICRRTTWNNIIWIIPSRCQSVWKIDGKIPQRNRRVKIEFDKLTRRHKRLHFFFFRDATKAGNNAKGYRKISETANSM